MSQIVDTLIDWFNKSFSMVEETNKYFDQLTSSIPAADAADWSAAIIEAEKERLEYPAVMDILGAQKYILSELDPLEDQHIASVGEDWCRLALSVEERQIDIQDHVRRLGKEPREEEQQEVERLREILVAELSQVFTLENKAMAELPRTTDRKSTRLNSSHSS